MTETSTRRSRWPEVVVAVGLLASVAYLARVLSHRFSDRPEISLKVMIPGAAPKTLVEGDQVDLAAALNLEVTIKRPAFVYVWVIEGEHVNLLWQPSTVEKAWDPGTYSPDWGDGSMQLFNATGAVRLLVVSAPALHVQAAAWTVDDLRELNKRCADCSSSVLNLVGVGTAPARPAQPSAP